MWSYSIILDPIKSFEVFPPQKPHVSIDHDAFGGDLMINHSDLLVDTHSQFDENLKNIEKS